jgi:hypothetical protein
MIQRNAIASWRKLKPGCSMILFGDEEGTREAAREYDAMHYPEIPRNEYNTPMVNAVFEKAADLSDDRVLCYVNADIILTSDFMEAFNRVKNLTSFLMVGRRRDLDIEEPLHLGDTGWENEIRMRAMADGILRHANYIDYFLFDRNLYGQALPPFAIGRTAWDNWLLYYARKTGVPVIDATGEVIAIHQNHRYNERSVILREDGTWEGYEVRSNRELAGKHAVNYNIEDATLVLSGGKLMKQRSKVRARRFLVTRFPGIARFVVSTARRAGFLAGEESRG